MPELPEIETVVRGLRPWLVGAECGHLQILQPQLRWPVAVKGLRKAILGARVDRVWRRAKYIVWDLNSGASVWIHLGMSGTLRRCAFKDPLRKHEHAVFGFGTDVQLRLHDPRRFGMIDFAPTSKLAQHPRFCHLGPEPLSDDFSGDYLYRLTRDKRVSIKVGLMNAKWVVGVGNIYASEALFRAGIHPRIPAQRCGRERCERLVATVRDCLMEAISRGGTTLRDFADVDGHGGRYVECLSVYGREGKPCSGCQQGIVRREVMGGRSTYYCPRCQQG